MTDTAAMKTNRPNLEKNAVPRANAERRTISGSLLVVTAVAVAAVGVTTVAIAQRGMAGMAQVGPIDIGAQVFAGHFALSHFFNLDGTLDGRRLVVQPEADGSLRHAELAGELHL